VISDILQEVTERFAARGVDPYNINNGFCVEWSDEVYALLQNTEHSVAIWETPWGFADTYHQFLLIDERFYDAECHQGVADHMDLPIFARMAIAGASRQPIWCLDHNGKYQGTGRIDMTDEMVRRYNQENGII